MRLSVAGAGGDAGLPWPAAVAGREAGSRTPVQGRTVQARAFPPTARSQRDPRPVDPTPSEGGFVRPFVRDQRKVLPETEELPVPKADRKSPEPARGELEIKTMLCELLRVTGPDAVCQFVASGS